MDVRGTIKKAEHQRTDAFELWCWRRLLRVPWTERRSNQSILKEISPECSLEGLMLKLKHQYFGHLIQRTDSLEKILMLWKIEGRRRRGWQRMRWLNGITDSWTWVWVSSGSWWWTGKPGVLQSMGSQRVGHDWETELNWTELNTCHGDPVASAQAYLHSSLPLPVCSALWKAWGTWPIGGFPLEFGSNANSPFLPSDSASIKFSGIFINPFGCYYPLSVPLTLPGF